MDLVSFGLGADWIARLWKCLRRTHSSRQSELAQISREVFLPSPLDLAKYYVEPDCQEANPADRHDEDFFVSREPIMRKVDEFLGMKCFQQGNNQLFVLSDAGMGKTALLTILKLMHLCSFWPRSTDCILRKLGPKTLDQLRAVSDPGRTILLLDALDEDPTAFGNIQDRLLTLLRETQPFLRVIITCRTQFFPKVERDPFERPGRVMVGGFVCPTKYIALFNDRQVDSYLRKRFPNRCWFIRRTRIRQDARAIVDSMGSLRCRPMLLAYIEDIMGSSIEKDESEYPLFEALVRSWLCREESKTGLSAGRLWRACEELAVAMHTKHQRSLSESELERLLTGAESTKAITAIDIKGRSLLNRNSDGDYRFAHYAIQEFLVAHRIVTDEHFRPDPKVPATDFLLDLLRSRSDWRRLVATLDYQGVDESLYDPLDVPTFEREGTAIKDE